MEVKETKKISIRKTTTCPKGSAVLGMFDSLQAGSAVAIKSVIGATMINGKYPVYLDEEDRQNLYGFIDAFESMDELPEIIQDKNYRISLTSKNGTRMFGTLDVLIPEGAAVQASTSELQEELNEAIESAIASGYVTREEMDKRKKVMEENHVDDYLQLRIIKRYRNYNKPVHYPSTVYQDPYLERSLSKKVEGIVSEGLRAAVSRHAIICEGEKSVGKNVYLETIAWLMGMPLYLITFSRQMSPSSIYGEKTTDNSAAAELANFDHRILLKAKEADEKKKMFLNYCIRRGMSPSDAKKELSNYLPQEDFEAIEQAERFEKLKAQSASVNIVIDQSELYDWLSDGGLIVFNEMNMAEANFFASFTNQLLDGTGFLFIPGRGEVRIHRDCVLFGTQNADYQGVEQQNEATMSRFGCIVFPQPESIKKQLIAATESAIKKGDSPNARLDAKYFDECQAFYKQCRDAVKKGLITNACLNIRGFVRALTIVAESNGYSKLKRQVEINVIDTCPSDDRQPLIATLEQIITL